jgi:hypothetical protein
MPKPQVSTLNQLIFPAELTVNLTNRTTLIVETKMNLNQERIPNFRTFPTLGKGGHPETHTKRYEIPRIAHNLSADGSGEMLTWRWRGGYRP